jgi:transcriptional regulator with XRE-family HTH domain
MENVYDEEQFYRAFAKDLSEARALVVIQSPFLRENRIRKLQPLLQGCMQRHVRICVFAQTPSKDDAAATAGAKLLQSMGIHVTYRRSIHEKLAIIDEHLLWEGSLNILSHAASSERMRRWVDRTSVNDAIVRHRLNKCGICQVQRAAPQSSGTIHELTVIGGIIEKRRESLGLSQRGLATIMGMHPSEISKIETGKRIPRLDTIVRICEKLKLRIRPVPEFALHTLEEITVERLPQTKLPKARRTSGANNTSAHA